MTTEHLTELLHSYSSSITLTEMQLSQLQIYLELLLKWNARMNLTAVRDPEQIVLRHFGESIFAAVTLFPSPEAAGSLEVA